jgi:hypothetical protein
VPKVAPGGVVMLHDTEVDYPENLPHEEAWPVRRAVEEFFAGRDIEWVTGCYGLAVIRI